MNNGKVTFKPYSMEQPSLLPPSLDEIIPPQHLVRVVNRVIDELDIKPLLEKYKGGGTSSYHPRMMLKVIVYAYTQKIYSSRKIEKALWENIGFLWISGGNKPDFHTLNNFRGEVMKEEVRQVFASLLEWLVEEGYVKMENYFVDGTKVGADSNPHKVIWAKKTQKYKTRLQEQIAALLDEIEQVNEQEDAAYGERNLEELGEESQISAEKLKQKVSELNEVLQRKPEDKQLKQAVKQLEKKDLPRLEKYEEQERLLAGRNSYSKTDPDASSLRMKEDRAARKPLARPAYNVQMGTEGQFVVGYSIHQQADDTSCFIPHMQQQVLRQGKRFKNGSGDAGYGSERRTTPGWNSMKWATTSNTTPSTGNNIRRASRSCWKSSNANLLNSPTTRRAMSSSAPPKTAWVTSQPSLTNPRTATSPNGVSTSVCIVQPARSKPNAPRQKATGKSKSASNYVAIANKPGIICSPRREWLCGNSAVSNRKPSSGILNITWAFAGLCSAD